MSFIVWKPFCCITEVDSVSTTALDFRHLMMQTTLFIGPVDFYYTDRA